MYTCSSERKYIARYKYYNVQPAFVKTTFPFSHVDFSHIDAVKSRIIKLMQYEYIIF